MAKLFVSLDVRVLTTAKAKFKHLISGSGERTWCNQIGAEHATEITPLRPTPGPPLADDWHKGMCPKCLHYLTWLEANSEPLENLVHGESA